MFTGIIEGRASVVSVHKTSKGARLTLRVPASFARLRPGASVAVNGACLTVSGRGARRLRFDLLRETMKRTAFGGLQPGATLNLERALKWNGRLEGHVVQGHVDGRGRVLQVISKGREKSLRIAYPRALRRFFVEKGSVAVNGVSLTLGKVGPASFWVHVIPVTLRKTTLGGLRKGDAVHLEADILLKSFRRLTRSRRPYKLSDIKG